MICGRCGKEFMQNPFDGPTWFCENCRNILSKPKQKPEINADRIRTMSDEELCFLFVNTERFANLMNVSYAEMIDWLRQPAEGEQHED